ncbi:MAG: hypothetical protein QG640_116 [Patescibacteria group bacterium]|nr:hypothetical protein [Patescibacteria group bacterium]
MPPEELTERCQPLRKSNMIGIAHTVVQHIRDSGLRLEKVVNGFEFNYLKQTIIGCDSVSEDDFRFMRELIERNFSRGRKKQKEMVLFGQLN